jgi:flavin reductase
MSILAPREGEEQPRAIERGLYRNAMARLGAAVNIITTDGPAGRAGFTASAVCSVTDEPPTLLVCVNRTSYSHSIVFRNRVLCVNTLAAKQQEISALFGRKCSVDERFNGAEWSTLETGAPALNGALVTFDCNVADVVERGTHDVFFCQVVAIRDGDPQHGGLMYFNRGYHALDPEWLQYEKRTHAT